MTTILPSRVRVRVRAHARAHARAHTRTRTRAHARKKFGSTTNVHTYGFSNLYTSIPHGKRKENRKQFANKVLGTSGKLFINVKNKKVCLPNTIADEMFGAKTLQDAIFL